MKTYDQLCETEKQRAYDKVNNQLVEDIVSGQMRFNDKLNHDDLQKRIDKAIAKAEKMQTPWFAAEYLFDDPIVTELIDAMVRAQVEEALYPEPNEYVIDGIVMNEKGRVA